MFVFQIMGGLGNQMFQYAAARALSKKRNIPFKLDFDDPYIYVKRRFNLDVFQLKNELANQKDLQPCKPKRRWEKRWYLFLGRDPNCKLYKEKKDFQYDDGFFDCPDGSYLSGFWQSEKYFQDIADIIRLDFRFLNAPTLDNKKWLKLINSTTSVSVHVRRGDYVSVPKTNLFHGTCGIQYYKEAIRIMNVKIDNPTFFFFSDDIEWVKKNIVMPYPSYYVDANDDLHNYEDLRLMSSCDHHIIANSSFSWWGAWLSNSENKQVIAPIKWLSSSIVSTDDLIPSSWIRL